MNLIGHAREMGKILGEGLEKLKEKHACVGEVRYIGLHSAVELVKNRATHELLTMDRDGVPILTSVTANFKKRGFTLVGHANNFCISPALVVTKQQLQEMLAGVDVVLSDYDEIAAE